MNKFNVIKNILMSLIITDYLLVVHQMMNLIVIHTSLQMLSQRIAQLRRLQELLLKQWIKLLQKK